MTNIDFSNVTDKSDINSTDQLQTFDISSGDDVPKTRDLQQILDWMSDQGLTGGGSGGTGLTGANVYRTTLGTLTANITRPTDVISDSAITPPAEARAARLELNVQGAGIGSISYADWSALLAINGTAPPSTGLSATNSVAVTIGGVIFYVAKANNVSGATNTTDEHFAIGADTNGDYTIGLTYIELALEPWADKNTPNEIAPYSRLPIPDPGMTNANKVATATATGAIIWQDTQAPASVGGSQELETRSSIPAITGFAVGDIINVNGELYELVANTEDSNVYRGVVASNAMGQTGYFGDDTFAWQTVSPYNFRAKLPRAGLGSSPPTIIYAEFNGGSGDHAAHDSIELARSAGLDDNDNWGYVHNPGSSALEYNTVGAPFSLTMYSDAAHTTAVTFHAASRFERDKRDIPNVSPVAIVGNTDRWAKSKLPADTNYGTGVQVTPGIALTEVNPSANLTGGTNANAYPTGASLFSPTIDLDDYPHGEFHFELDLVFTPGGGTFPNMGFERGKANQTDDDRRRTLTAIVFASRIRAQQAVQATGANVNPNGVSAFRIPVYDNLTVQGYYNLVITRDDQNRVGYYWYWEMGAGTSTPTIAATLDGTFTSNDLAGGAPVTSNRRTGVWATSGKLPAGTYTANQAIPLSWTLGSPSGFTLSGNTLSFPAIRNAEAQRCLGFWIVGIDGSGTERIEQFVPIQWGIPERVYWHPHSGSRIDFFLDPNGNVQFRAIGNNYRADSNYNFAIYGAI